MMTFTLFIVFFIVAFPFKIEALQNLRQETDTMEDMRIYITCAGLNLKRFCTGPRFIYTDGCNVIRSKGRESGIMTMISCVDESKMNEERCNRVRKEALKHKDEALL